jgi:hypothetical protein
VCPINPVTNPIPTTSIKSHCGVSIDKIAAMKHVRDVKQVELRIVVEREGGYVVAPAHYSKLVNEFLD